MSGQIETLDINGQRYFLPDFTNPGASRAEYEMLLREVVLLRALNSHQRHENEQWRLRRAKLLETLQQEREDRLERRNFYKESWKKVKARLAEMVSLLAAARCGDVCSGSRSEWLGHCDCGRGDTLKKLGYIEGELGNNFKKPEPK